MRRLLFGVLVLLVTLHVEAQHFDTEEYYGGYYLDTSGTKVYGFIRYRTNPNPRIEFRPRWEDKSKRVYPEECNGFVLRDSIRFIRVIGSFKVKCGVGMIEVTADFVRVLDTGKVNLYMHYSTSGNGSRDIPGIIYWDNLVVRKNDPAAPYIGLHPNLKKRRKALEEKLKGEDELIEILCREKVEDVRSGLKEYNSR